MVWSCGAKIALAALILIVMSSLAALVFAYSHSEACTAVCQKHGYNSGKVTLGCVGGLSLRCECLNTYNLEDPDVAR